MANIKSAKKRVKQTSTKTYQNAGYKIAIEKGMKGLLRASSAKEKQKQAQELTSTIDKSVKRNIMHKNKAARLKRNVQKMVTK